MSEQTTYSDDVCAPKQGNRYAYRFLKRVFDIILSICVIVIGFIPCCILCIPIAITTGGSPIYTQRRLGLRGKPFCLLKFRTMVVDADDVEKHFNKEQLIEWKRERKVSNDPRTTALGRFLRRTSFDEIPQFLNVFVGQMSTVGVRPVVKDELRHYNGDAQELLSLKPGVTGWWQVHRRNAAVYEDGRRQEQELYYVRHANIGLDFKIFLRTFKVVVQGTGR